MSGWADPSQPSMPSMSLAVSPARVWLGRITSRSASTAKPKVSATWRNISLCWPVATTAQRKSLAPRSAATTGASLTASGRVPMKTAMLRVVVRALSPLASLVALDGRLLAQAAGDNLPAGEPDELAVGGEVALPQLSGLHQEPPEPLQPRQLEPARGPLNVAGQDIEAAAYPQDNGHVEALPVALAPGLLEGAGHADEQDVGAARPDFFDDDLVVLRAEVAVAEAGDLDARVPDTARFYQIRHHLAPGAEEVDAQPVLSSRCQEARHEIHAGHSLRYRLA